MKLYYKLLLFFYLIINVVGQNPCAQKVYRGPDNPMTCVCNATYCDEFPPLGTLGQNQAAIYTSSQSGLRFNRTAQNFVVGSPTGDIILVPNDTDKRQNIIGFGGAFTDAATINMARLSQGAKTKLIGAYFGPEGIGYTTGRVPIASCDFSTHIYSYDDYDGDFNLQNFSLAMEDYNYKLPAIKQAQTLIGNRLRLFASPWSAPGWLKESGCMTGGGGLKGDLDGPYFQTWANYFVRFFEEYAKNGVNFWGVTMENEPRHLGNCNNTYQAMNLNSSVERDFAKGFWGKALRANPATQNLKLMIFDHNRDGIEDYSGTVFGDPTAYNIVDGLAVHWYGDEEKNLKALPWHHERFPAKFILYTEACNAGPNFGVWFYGDRYAHSLTEVLNNWVTGWTDWNMCVNSTGGPSWFNNNVDSPIVVSNSADEFEKQPMYYALGHFAKFIVPDSTILGLTVLGNATNLEGVAALTPTNQKVIVLNNRDVSTTYAISILNKMNATLNLNLEPRSFTTIVYDE